MIFNKHSYLEGRHAFLSPSNTAWQQYDDEKLDRRFMTAMASVRGTEMHKLAHDMIRLGVKFGEDVKSTMAMYVNDAIGFRMTPEQPLYFSENCFGTADAIAFRQNLLRIADLKTGTTPTSVQQLEAYAALFCLEYQMLPFSIDIELRIYQSKQVKIFDADPDTIMHVMEKIKSFDKRINAIREEALS